MVYWLDYFSMEKKLISRQAVKAVLLDYWGQYKTYPFATFTALILPAVGTIFTLFVPPLLVAKLVDRLAAGTVYSVHDVVPLILLLGVLWLLGEAFWRIGMYYLTRIEEKGINTLIRTVYKRLSVRDYDFYADNFVGSLVKKGIAYPRNFEVFTDTLVFNITTNVFPILFAVILKVCRRGTTRLSANAG